MVTEKEMDAVRFYEGDLRKSLENGQFSESLNNEGLFGIPSAYKTMNCLMFDGIGNEKERIREKSGSLKPDVFLEAEKVVEVFCDIYRAMCKNAAEKKNAVKQLVYRTERGISVQELKKGQTVSFTSTSKENDPEDFLKEKSGLTLLDFIFSSEIPHLDFEELFGEDYLFKGQKEILLPPFLEIEMEPLKLTSAELQYRDADSRPPSGKYLVLVKGMRWDDVNINAEPEAVFEPERCRQAAELLAKISRGEEPDEAAVMVYCLWKRNVRDIIKKEFYEIYRSYFGQAVNGEKQQMAGGENGQENPCAEQRDDLIEDVEKMRQEFNKKRQNYKSKIDRYHWVMNAASVVPLVCMALSFAEPLEIFMKILAVIMSAVSIFLSQALQTEVYDQKLQQRSKTYLELCDLSREMKYESEWNEKNMKAYVLRYRNIMKDDKIMSLSNIELQIQNVQKLYQSEINV